MKTRQYKDKTRKIKKRESEVKKKGVRKRKRNETGERMKLKRNTKMKHK